MVRRSTKTKPVVKPAAQPLENTRTHAQALRSVLDLAPVDSRPLSMRAATTHKHNPNLYTKHEREVATHAMDFSGESLNALSFVENTSFPGFPSLALLSQLPEYRTMHETLADECVRTWGHVTSAGGADDAKIADLEAELLRLDVKAIVRQAVIHDQAFGGAHIYFKLKGDEDFRSTPLVMKKFSVRKGAFEGLRVIEPYWVTPNFYNSIDPTAADFYKPSSWWMLGVMTHATRLQTLVSRPVPDMLKPTYSFRGISMTQLAMPYIDNWLRTRQSVSDTLKQFSISGIKTDLQQSLAPGGSQDLGMRAALINAYRDNRNILFLDNATEEFFQVNTPLSGLDALQAQAQEQMSAVSHIPLVKLLGITPSGLNASSEGEIRVFYDYVSGYRENVLNMLLENILKLAQLSLFGEIDDHISWDWNPLLELDSLEAAQARAQDADTDCKYIEAGVVSPQQVTARLAADHESLYSGVLDQEQDLEDLPDDDIAGITSKILEIAPEIPGAPMEPSTEGGEHVGTMTQSQPGVYPDDTGGAVPGTLANSDPTEQGDPGEMTDTDETIA